ncbi:MAG: hypothetical protein CO187_02870 [Zetaproteobacteria bacterium CG_4_9_14_3_um_filter_53_7]|nr:MAG: hypothetical protein CO187_02870 [Zetaproteobacteria bacterium CG_4_9_14_3_um_filter_53_7]
MAVTYAVIYKAVSKAELSARMQRDFLIKQFDAEVKAMKQETQRKIYIARTHIIWRIGYFLNGDRNRKIREIKLTGAELLASENQALAACVDMTSLNANMDMAYKLRVLMNTDMHRPSLNLPLRYLQFVMTFNPEAFETGQTTASAGKQCDAENQPVDLSATPDVQTNAC